MGKRNDCWGIEVGANAIKAIRLQRQKDQVVLADFEVGYSSPSLRDRAIVVEIFDDIGFIWSQ